MRKWLSALSVTWFASHARADVACDYSEVQMVQVTASDTGDTSNVAGDPTFSRSGVPTPLFRPESESLELVWRTTDSLGERVVFHLRVDEALGVFELQVHTRTASMGTSGAVDAGALDTGEWTNFDPGDIFGRRFRCRGRYK